MVRALTVIAFFIVVTGLPAKPSDPVQATEIYAIDSCSETELLKTRAIDSGSTLEVFRHAGIKLAPLVVYSDGESDKGDRINRKAAQWATRIRVHMTK